MPLFSRQALTFLMMSLTVSRRCWSFFMSRSMSMEEIGREFSGRDHSTIVYSLKTMERDMKNDQHLRETVSDIIKNVKA